MTDPDNASEDDLRHPHGADPMTDSPAPSNRRQRMLTVDARCNHTTCRNKNIYRMVGSCSNCGTKNLLILFTEGHDANHAKPCPVCGCDRVRAERLATEDEIPVG